MVSGVINVPGDDIGGVGRGVMSPVIGGVAGGGGDTRLGHLGSCCARNRRTCK